jgi:geranylgeranyl transferase type-2 subunit beta
MQSGNYLLQLTLRLADGLSRVPAENRQRHEVYLQNAQNADGGFSGREGGSDLYYTGFALRSLAVLGALTPALAERAAVFLRASLTQQASVIDLFSLLYSCILVQLSGGPDVLANSALDWPDRLCATLETFRTPDGGYAKTSGGVSGSTYHTFLVALTYQLLDRALPEPDAVVRFVRSRQREDGGYVEIAAMRRSGTNPTAAAVGILQMLDGTGSAPLTSQANQAAIDFLAAMPSEEAGLRANGRAPLADLLSTFTGAWTLHQLGALTRIDTGAAARYARALELPSGGFRGGFWDDRTDPEYTFYGLGVRALVED